MIPDTDLKQKDYRLIIIKGIANNLSVYQISEQLGINQWEIKRELKYMKHNKDPLLKQAYQDKEKHIEKKLLSNILNDKFIKMTGVELSEQSFFNMINYYRPELMKVINSNNEHEPITKLPSNVKKTLIKNGIISGRSGGRGITTKARKFLLKKID
ncbi:hypothetical protein JW865_01050 [Candidatus Bathyarchaeota archaeon]|nr:hypothetical protein [Candidatus Bathyarchaeota archaeon]